MDDCIALTDDVDFAEMARLAVANTEGEFVGIFCGADMLFWQLHTVSFRKVEDPVNVDMEMAALDQAFEAVRAEDFDQHVLIRNVTSVVWDEPPNQAWRLAAHHAHVNAVAMIDIIMHTPDEGEGPGVHYIALRLDE